MKKSIELELDDFFSFWNIEQMNLFLQDIMEIVQLYYVLEDDDWVEKEVGEENRDNVRLIRTAYLISRFADNHCGKLARVKIDHKNLSKRLER